MSKKKYNGHESYAAWNVSLWVGNDEGLYSFAREHKRRHSNARDAARAMLEDLQELGIEKTPDGVTYSVHNLTLAIRGL